MEGDARTVEYNKLRKKGMSHEQANTTVSHASELLAGMDHYAQNPPGYQTADVQRGDPQQRMGMRMGQPETDEEYKQRRDAAEMAKYNRQR